MTATPSNCQQSPIGRRAALVAGLLAAMILVPAAATAYTKTFSAGAIIIPAQMEYQTDCGMTSAYGFIYSILYKNAELTKAGKKPVTIYWILEPKKLSHHRCDTGTDALPDYSKYNDNDGCDLAIQSAAGQPVARWKIDGTEEAPFDVFTTAYDKAKGYSTRTSPSPATKIDVKKQVVKYSGSLWVIDASDKATVLDLIKSDPLVQSFRDGGKCDSIPVATAGSHNIELHVARIGFTAPVVRQMNVKPPLIALLDAGAVTILQTYLKNAGLNDPVLLPNAGGTTTTHGIIYDTLDPVTDFVSTPTYPLGALNMPDPADATRSYYQVMWAPHWVADSQSRLPAANSPGDDQLGDGLWTHYDSTTGTYDDPITNALKNMGAFAEAGNGIFAECASIESFEGSYGTTGASCSGTSQCTCTDGAACTVGDVQPLGCGAGYTSACGACFQCPTGYTLDASVCGEETCVQNGSSPCTSGTFACKACYSCNSGYTLDAASCTQVTCVSGKTKYTPTAVAANLGTITKTSASCSLPGYQSTCVASASSIDVPGNLATHFQVSNLLNKNGLGNSFGGPDCTDAQVTGTKYKYPGALTGDCFDFHPTTGGPATIFSQKGNFNYTGTSGHIHQYMPPSSVGSYYKPSVMLFATSRNKSDASRDGWDFTSARHKDGDPGKGMIVYLAGHSYQNDVAGNRIVLNTMLNLGFSDSGVEIARSEPVGYVTRKQLTDGSYAVIAETVFQGTYVQRPFTFQDWVYYTAGMTKSWKFPYVDGHLRAYPLEKIAAAKQTYSANSLWDAAARLPLPKDRRIGTALGGRGPAGWKAIDMKYTQTDPSTCASSRKDAKGQPICDLSWELASCNTAGITQSQLQAGDVADSAKATLGMFVQQVRGHCSSHDKVSGVPNYVPTDQQCDDLKQQKNRAKLGGIDHSSPGIAGPSRYIGDEALLDGSTLPWSKRPVVAYAGGRDGMLHAFYVYGEYPSWSAEGVSLPGGVAAGQELWAFIPPGQLCGLQTNTAMVDATVNVVDAFGNFPKDANHDGIIDWSSAGERPTGRRTWRTVLVASVGEGGSELFALDVTNPLLPVLLWHLGGASDKDSLWFDMSKGTWDAMSLKTPATYAYKWFNWDDGAPATLHIPTPYNTTDLTILDQIKTGRYDYGNMGRAFGTAIGMVWQGNAFRYLVFVTSSTAEWTSVTPLGYRGLETYAIDLATGEKQWQWQNRYTRADSTTTVIADNSIPGRPALVDTNYDGSVDRLYAGDMEGRMWELDAPDGKNHNYLQDSETKKYWSLPLFGTPDMTGTGADPVLLASYLSVSPKGFAQQPLTSPIGVGRMLIVPPALEPYLRDRISVAQGTMGVDWTIAPFEKGHVFVLPVYPETMVTPVKDPVTGNVTLKTIDTRDRDIRIVSKPDLLRRGVLLSAAEWDVTLAVGERVFGMPKIVGNALYVNTAVGGFSGDLTETVGDYGRTIAVTATGPATVLEVGKAFGGALVMDNAVVVSSTSGMIRTPLPIPTPTDATTNPRNRYTPTDFTTWEQLPPTPLK